MARYESDVSCHSWRSVRDSLSCCNSDSNALMTLGWYNLPPSEAQPSSASSKVLFVSAGEFVDIYKSVLLLYYHDSWLCGTNPVTGCVIYGSVVSHRAVGHSACIRAWFLRPSNMHSIVIDSCAAPRLAISIAKSDACVICPACILEGEYTWCSIIRRKAFCVLAESIFPSVGICRIFIDKAISSLNVNVLSPPDNKTCPSSTPNVFPKRA